MTTGTGAEGPGRYSDETARSLGLRPAPLYTLSDEELQAIRKDPSEPSQRRKGAADILGMRQVQRGEIRGAGRIQS